MPETTETTPTAKARQVFGPDRARFGHEDQEWAVWLTTEDSVVSKASLQDALETAAEMNAVAYASHDGHQFSPVVHALVLHRGYVWTRQSDS